MQLIKALPKIAARVLHNTRTVHPDMKFKFELLAEAYGAASVMADFEKWCHENTDGQFKYPVNEYLKVIDSRLGSAPEEKRMDLKDPQVSELVSFSYELTGILPAASAVAELVLNYPVAEIKAALSEYTESLTETEIKGSMKAFYSSGGGAAIILARRRRAVNAS